MMEKNETVVMVILALNKDCCPLCASLEVLKDLWLQSFIRIFPILPQMEFQPVHCDVEYILLPAWS